MSDSSFSFPEFYCNVETKEGVSKVAKKGKLEMRRSQADQSQLLRSTSPQCVVAFFWASGYSVGVWLCPTYPEPTYRKPPPKSKVKYHYHCQCSDIYSSFF